MNTPTREEEILNFMKSLSISREEAEELYESDHSDEVLPEVEEMEKKAKQIKRYEKSDKKRKSTPRERKVDPNKLAVYTVLAEALKNSGIEFTGKNESELSFNYCGGAFTVKLIKHRPSK